MKMADATKARTTTRAFDYSIPMVGIARAGGALVVAVLLTQATFAQAIFSMPGSVLFFWDGALELREVAATNEHALALQLYPGPWSHPVVARDASRVASGFFATPVPVANHLTLGVFSFTRQEWKTYGNFAEIGAPGISPDGTRVAFVAKQVGGHNAFLILDTSSGMTDSVTQLEAAASGEGPSWSPDGKRLAVVVVQKAGIPAIAVYDLSTSELNVVGKGGDPSWSPTGEWIAYFETGERCILVHPDGTKTKVVRNLGRLLRPYRGFRYPAVWSPDGKQLLLDELKGEGPNIDVMLVDVESGKVTRKSHNGLAVVGWAAWKP